MGEKMGGKMENKCTFKGKCYKNCKFGGILGVKWGGGLNVNLGKNYRENVNLGRGQYLKKYSML